MALALKVISARMSAETVEQVDRAAQVAGVSRSDWVAAAILNALDAEADFKTPAVIREAMPQRTRMGMRLPGNRTYDRFPR